MTKIAAGVLRFQKGAFRKKAGLFRELAEGQAPEALFITCSDSRIDPNLITQSEPGELFICRNAGNIIPPHSQEHTGAMTASIEFAVGALKVPHIIICGHKGCGAMNGAMAPETLDGFPHVREWLAHVGPAKKAAVKKWKGLSAEAKLDLLTEENVILQMTHIRSHPYVAAALEAGETRLHGWVYDIASGAVAAYDEAKQAFIPLADHYRDEIANILHARKGAEG